MTSSDYAIRVQGLGKKYGISHEGERERYASLRDAIVSGTKGLFKRDRRSSREDFWALRDVSFDVAKGDAIGIIGRNGAGKSTFLKVLSRITEPSEGEVRVTGRVSSLLEVGTGFHPELTGRENIYLNGTILGMRRSEIKQRFDEIVEFSGVEQFLDTPVKRYSSGMYTRLAFAVAAHLDSEILVVDEVLAVGDAEFQKKCLGRMQDIAGQGRTVLFVSHNMAAIRTLCTRGILLDHGRLIADKDVSSIIAQYSSHADMAYNVEFAAKPTKPSITAIRVDEKALVDRNIVVEIDFESPTPLDTPVGGLVLRAPSGEAAWGSNGRFHSRTGEKGHISTGTLRCEAEGLPIANGSYLLSIWLADWYQDYDEKLDVLNITIGDDRVDPLRPPGGVIGFLDWPAVWSTKQSSGDAGDV